MKVTPRLRMFAGPNGSGKSTIKEVVPSELLGVYINPDEIEKELRKTAQLNLASFQVKSTNTEFITYLKSSSLLKKVNLLHRLDSFSCIKNIISSDSIEINSYYASVISSFIREKLLNSKTSFTFETVMSSPDKVEFLNKARKNGFRAYLFDNSGNKSVWLAEIINGVELEYKSELIPNWFKSTLKEILSKPSL